MLLGEAREAIEKIDLAEGARFLDEDFGVAHGLRLGALQVRHSARPGRSQASLDLAAFKELVRAKGRDGLRRKRDRIPGHGRAVPLHHPRRRGPEALRPRAARGLGPRAVRRRT